MAIEVAILAVASQATCNYYPPVSKVSREVANLTERKNLQTPVYGVKEFGCLSVCL